MERIESPKNAKVKAWKKLHTKRGREKSSLFFIEGRHLIEEALKANVPFKELIIREGEEMPREWKAADVKPVEVTDRVMRELADTETPQGFAAICELPENRNIPLEKGQFLFLDRIQDPGNLGTIIRTAHAAGINGLVLSEGTADPYNSKVLRAAQGSVFHIPVQKMELGEAVTLCQENKVPVFGTSLEGSTYSAIEPQENFALILGNEGQGIEEALLEQTDQNIYIPLYGGAESLNVSVACGILVYHLKQV
ncbi:TrmH family RNA methyltransferase [Alteribacter natronophilus]|uniref:TrmH family RNA methyltransferase n=1 Tax=Alteribacter natronophilus TaxID=2583810 RepID=UPI00110ED08C|nr:RNA methyltransferase [Alteribacter natronophilus]TMW71662.1 RNA methyltransferase [Alteribacter natronophilus]